MPAFKNITQQRFGRLIALLPQGKDNHGMYRWLCQCDCGREKVVRSSDLIQGKTKSCGCFHDEAIAKRAFRHGHSKGAHSKGTKTYSTWMAMRDRCRYPNYKDYKYYGGKGIKVCERWNSFENFLTDMGERPEGLTLDRIDSNGDYEPGNCRWATWAEQRANQCRSDRT